MADVELEVTGTGTIDDLLDKARAEAAAEAAAAESTEETPSAPPKTKRTRTTRSRGKKDLTEELTSFYTTIGAGVFAFNQPDGVVILANAEKMAESLNKWGDADPRIRKVLERLCTTSAMGAVIGAHAPVVLAILGNHDLIPKFGNKDANEDSQNPPSATETNGTAPANPGNGMGNLAGVTPVIMESGRAR